MSLLNLLAILCSLHEAANEVYYITNSSSDHCTVQPCLTLSQFAANLSHYLHSNTTLVFLPGTHYLSKVNLTLSNVENFTMKSKSSTVQIKCMNNSHIHFSQLQCILITKLEFVGCGGNQVKHVHEFLVSDTKFEGKENSGTALELTETAAQIINTTFVSNRKGVYRQCPVYDLGRGCLPDGFIGGAITATSSSNINISQSKFEDNGADFGGAILADSSIINMSGNVFLINNTATNAGGVLCSINSAVTIDASIFNNNFADRGGGVLSSFTSTVAIEASGFHGNIATDAGGVLLSTHSIIRIETSQFDGNSAYWGGVLYSLNTSTITIEASEFVSNSAYWGGVLSSPNSSTIAIEAGEFYGNSATLGGVLDSTNSNIIVQASEFDSNSAYWGGVLYSTTSNIIIEASDFDSNSATNGGVYCHHTTNITIGDCNFTNNSATVGAVFYALYDTKIQYHNYLLIDNNSADDYAVIYLSDSEFRGYNSGSVLFLNNFGSLLVGANSNLNFSGYAKFVNNQPSPTTTGAFHEGGAITLFQSNVFFDGECNLEHNHAENGGAIHSTESSLYVNGNVTIAHNTATGNGGGVYLSNSELNCQQESTFVLYNNAAMCKGGGLHAISSSIKASSNIKDFVSDHNNTDLLGYIGTRINFTSNAAKFGGGLSLEANAKLDILKHAGIPPGYYEFIDINTTLFIANSADYGGAVYVDDDTNSGTCDSDPKTECFFQVLALYVYADYTNDNTIRSIYFSQNYAIFSGSTLYGGLLDRCAVSQFSEVYKKYAPGNKDGGGGIAYFRNVSTIANISIASGPVRSCFCSNDGHDSTYQNHVDVKKGEAFTVSLVAVDQVGQPVSATIQAYLSSAEGGLAEGQLAKKISAKCTNLTFNVVSPHASETLALFASNGPCRNVKLSRATVEIHFLPCSCPIGLQISGMNNTNCTCKCHNKITGYVEQCDSHCGSLIKQPQSRAWISYINDTSITGYLVYPNCPFDYCLLTSPPVYLNQPNGADAQCAFNRTSLLCGSCQPGLSLSLGSSHCLPCPSYWPALLIAITIAAILAGITLVTSLLVLNMTVAVGTLNGLIFYANVVYVNKSILLPFQGTNFVTIFISWLNLDLGFDTCYFPGMDTYIKTWLQLAFPTYVFLLVYLVIKISSKSTKFLYQIRKKDPVATLATLILFSYAKFIEVCFKSLSFGILEYPDGSNVSLWLPDAKVKYLSVNHLPLFITAVVILLVGLAFPTLLFSWQFLLRLPNGRISKLTENIRIKSFIEYYHTPYTAEHRYWTGLLLIVRIILYLVDAVDVSNDPTVALTAIIFTMCCIFALRLFFGGRLYRKWPLDVLETLFCLNILLFATFTWYSLDNPNSNKKAVAYTSITITIATLMIIILYHVYTYMFTSLFSKIKKTKLGRMDYTDDPGHTDDYDTTPLLTPPPVEPTFSVVELSHSCPAPPDPKDAIAQNTPADSAERGGSENDENKRQRLLSTNYNTV